MFAAALQKARAAFAPPLWRSQGGGREGVASRACAPLPRGTPARSTPPRPSPALRAREGATVAAALRKARAAFAPPLWRKPRGRPGGGRFARMRSTTAQDSRQKHPSPTLPCAARKGGGRVCRCAAKSPSCFCPSPLAQAKGEAGRGSLRSHALRHRAELPPEAPLPNPPLRCAQGRGPRLPLRCEKPELLLPLPFGASQGGGWEGVAWRACAPLPLGIPAKSTPPRPSPALRARAGVTSAQDRRQGRCAS